MLTDDRVRTVLVQTACDVNRVFATTLVIATIFGIKAIFSGVVKAIRQ